MERRWVCKSMEGYDEIDSSVSGGWWGEGDYSDFKALGLIVRRLHSGELLG